jgi:glycosyltransferase involved in cell wall biosynthesis
MRVHQLGHGLIPGDAVSYHTLEIDRRLRAWGLESRIFARHVAPEYQDLAQTDDHFLPFVDATDELLIYHYSIYDPNYRFFKAAQGRKILIYHNITPPSFFQAWDPSLAALCDAGRRVLAELRSCDLALGDSDFNRQELVELAFAPERTGVLPIFLSQATFEEVPTNRPLLERLRGHGGVNILSVGRLVPNKAIEDLIRIFGVYHRAVNPHSRLYLVGSRYVATYDEQLNALVASLGLQDYVTFTGLVSQSDLKTYYQAADLYLHASHHEGFCVPLIESMYFGVPILARKATAVPETLGDAGVLFTRLGYQEVAEMVHLLLTDGVLQAQVVARQRERLRDFAPSQVEARLRDILIGLGVLSASEEKAPG